MCRIRVVVSVLFLLLGLALYACTGGSTPGAGQQAVPEVNSGLQATLAELDAMPTPAGADAQTFAMLKAKLRTMLIAREAGKSASTVPTSNRSKVIDLWATDSAAGWEFFWRYRNEGDYNVDGIVNVADLAILGMEFGKNSASPDWPDEGCVADGNCDEQVDIGDLTSIGVGFGNQVTHYALQRSDQLGPGANWFDVKIVPWGQSGTNAGWRWFNYPFDFSGDKPPSGFYRAVPIDTTAFGIPGDPAPWDMDNRGDWWTFGRDTKHTRRSPLVGPAWNERKWFRRLGSEIVSSPAINATGRVYIAEVNGLMHAFTSNGEKMWQFRCPATIRSSPAVGAFGFIYFGCDDGYFYILFPDGTQHRRINSGYSIQYSPVINSDDNVILNNGMNTVSLDYLGNLNWTAYNTHGIEAPAIGDDGTIYINSAEGLKALNPTGTVLWTAAMGGGGSSPAIGADGTIYIGSQDNNLYAVNPDGTVRWSFITGDDVFSSPAIGGDGTIYFGSYDKNIYAVNPDGSLRWAYATGDIINSSPAISAEGSIYFACATNYLYCMNPDGTVKWTFAIANGFNSSPAIGSDGTVYIGGMDHTFYAFGPGA